MPLLLRPGTSYSYCCFAILPPRELVRNRNGVCPDFMLKVLCKIKDRGMNKTLMVTRNFGLSDRTNQICWILSPRDLK